MNPSKGPVHTGCVVLLTAALTPGGFVLAQNLLLAPIKKDMARLIARRNNSPHSNLLQSTPVDTGSFYDTPDLKTAASPSYPPVFNQEAFSILLSDLTKTLHALNQTNVRALTTQRSPSSSKLCARLTRHPSPFLPQTSKRIWQTGPEKPCRSRQPSGFPPSPGNIYSRPPDSKLLPPPRISRQLLLYNPNDRLRKEH